LCKCNSILNVPGPKTLINIFFQKKSIEITSKAPSKSATESGIKDHLEITSKNNSKNGEPSVKKAKISESLDDSAEGVEQVEEIDDEDED
jgi:hypothetical protein